MMTIVLHSRKEEHSNCFSTSSTSPKCSQVMLLMLFSCTFQLKLTFIMFLSFTVADYAAMHELYNWQQKVRLQNTETSFLNLVSIYFLVMNDYSYYV
jgi:hypothetical protein